MATYNDIFQIHPVGPEETLSDVEFHGDHDDGLRFSLRGFGDLVDSDPYIHKGLAEGSGRAKSVNMSRNALILAVVDTEHDSDVN